jgi:hypothetical protein
MARFLCVRVFDHWEPQAVLTMVPEFRPPRSTHSSDAVTLWLSMLVEAMEDAARPERRAQPCARATLAGLSAQLARPAPVPPGTTAPGRRN